MGSWRSLLENVKNQLLSVLFPRKKGHGGQSEGTPPPEPKQIAAEVDRKRKRKKKGKRAAPKGAKTLPKGVAEWMEKTGVSLQELAELTGYDKSTICHALHDKTYRQRLSPRFWGKLGAAIRLKVKPRLQEIEREGKKVFRCPRCKSFFIAGEPNCVTDIGSECPQAE
jgi:hypothetical protein